MREETTHFKMTLEPLRSAMAFGSAGETSLALPSDKNLRSGQQRVLEQVHTIKRSKSKYSSKSGSGTLSPASPQNDSVFYDQPFKFSPTTLNGTFNGSAFSKGGASINSQSKTVVQTQSFARRTVASKGSTSQRNLSSSSRKERPVLPLGPPAAYQSRVRAEDVQASRSVPDLTPFHAVQRGQTAQRSQANRASLYTVEKRSSSNTFLVNGPGQVANGSGPIQQVTAGQFSASQSFVKQPPSNHSNAESKISVPKSPRSESAGMNREGQRADVTMREAVEYLSSQDENYQLCGASFIQHSTYTEDKTKQEVLKLKGIAPLVALLRSPSPQVQLAASAALRNLVFRDASNKAEVQRCGGLAQALHLLKESDSAETQKHLTGLLWNLSSADSLKTDLVRSALPVLTESVVMPFVGHADQNTNTDLDPEVFYNATGCLRNLSSAKQGNRQAMRNSRGLIESLIRYVQACVAADMPDDKSVENCVCILHNLTYQLETEMPMLFSKMNALAGSPSRGTATTPSSPIGCFSSQSSNIQQESCFDYPVMEDNNPKGAGQLFHSKTLQTYLSLLGVSQKDATLEASCGALQNLTTNKGIVSSVLSQTVVQKLNGLQQISSLLQSPNPSLQRSAAALLQNLSRTPRLQSSLARQALPQLISLLCTGVTSDGDNGAESDDAMATTCHTVHSLLKAEPEIGKRMLSNSLVNSLNNLSQNHSMPKSSKAAAVLLYSLWSEKDFQSFLKKQGMHKRSFVNDITTAAHKSAQVIE